MFKARGELGKTFSEEAIARKDLIDLKQYFGKTMPVHVRLFYYQQYKLK